MDHIKEFIAIRNDAVPTSGEIPSPPDGRGVWLPLEEPFRSQTIAALVLIRRRRLEKQFGRMTVPRRFRDLSPSTLTAEEIVGKESAIAAAEAWARRESGKPGLLVWGLPGVGKSVLGWWAVPQRGWGLWQTWPEFYKAVQDGYSSGDAEAKMRAAQAVPVLFLDDLGDPDRVWIDREGNVCGRMATDDQRDILFRVVNHRVKEWAPIFITSNLDGAGLMVQFGDRIVSRLLEICEFVEMGGMDLRRARL